MDKFSSSTRERNFLPFNRKVEEKWQGDFTFVQAADTQFGMQESYIEKKTRPGWEPEKQWSRQLVQQVNQMRPRPRFLVICGDLLDAWPETQAETRDGQEKDFKKIFSTLQVPCVCVCGNHDIGNQPSMESVSKYRSSFGDDYFSFWCGGVYFLVINSQYYEDSTRVPQLAQDQEDWLEGQLMKIRRRKPKHCVIFQHIPLFLNDPHEDKEYFNFAKDLRQELLDKFYDAGVRHVFSGHYHRNAGGMYKDLQMVVTSAAGAQLGSDQPGYRVVSVAESRITHEYKTLKSCVSIPAVFAVLINAYDEQKRRARGNKTGRTVFSPVALPALRAQ
ncbi:hypothetical protein HAZT_HAZT012126 [Hyalella azteca]|nr:hypothetical protein HAZT_HAZT012126 [Hyalella azteca]